MRRIIFIFLATIFAIASGSFAPAMATNTIPAKAGEDWVHPHSKIVTPPEIGGIKRAQIIAFEDDFLNVGIAYETAGGTDYTTVYIYRNTNGTVPIWFSQAQSAIEIRNVFSTPNLERGIEIIPLSGTNGGQAIRAIYKSGPGSDFASTGLMLFSVGEWYVKIRISSVNRDTKSLADYMDGVLGQLSLPKGSKFSANLSPVADCAAPLVFSKKSKDVKQDMAASLMGLILAGSIDEIAEDKAEGDTAAKEAPEPEAVWCKDRRMQDGSAVYRPNEAKDQYLYAFGDSGRALVVKPDISSLLVMDDHAKKSIFAVDMVMSSATTSFARQNSLPSPERLMEIYQNGKMIGSASTWGEGSEITISD